MKTNYMAIGALAFGSATVPILAVVPTTPPTAPPQTVAQQPPAVVAPAKQMDVTSQNGLGTEQKPIQNRQSNQVQTRDTRYQGHDMGQNREAVAPIPVNPQSGQIRDTRYEGHDMGQNREAVPPIPRGP